MSRALTNTELALLSLVVEREMHGYEVERLVGERGMRNWTQVGFSSIYFVLRKLERAGLVASRLEQVPGRGPARRVYAPTDGGRAAYAANLRPPRVGADGAGVVPRRAAGGGPRGARARVRAERDAAAEPGGLREAPRPAARRGRRLVPVGARGDARRDRVAHRRADLHPRPLRVDAEDHVGHVLRLRHSSHDPWARARIARWLRRAADSA